MILILSKFAMNFYKSYQNATILKMMLILKNCHGRFTANYPKFLPSHSIHRQIECNFTPTFFEDLKDLTPDNFASLCDALRWDGVRCGLV